MMWGMDPLRRAQIFAYDITLLVFFHWMKISCFWAYRRTFSPRILFTWLWVSWGPQSRSLSFNPGNVDSHPFMYQISLLQTLAVQVSPTLLVLSWFNLAYITVRRRLRRYLHLNTQRWPFLFLRLLLDVMGFLLLFLSFQQYSYALVADGLIIW